MEDQYLLEIVVLMDKLGSKLETLRRRWPALKEQHRSHFFVTLEVRFPEYTEEDFVFLRQCKELWIVEAYKSKDAYKATGRRVHNGGGGRR